jgi:hypothetical protein
MLSKFIRMCKTEPAVLMYAVNAALTALVAFGFHATPGWTGAVTTIAAAVITIVTAAATRPVAVPVITGAVATIASAAAAFGLHLSSAQIGAAVPVLAIILSLVLRQAVTPLATIHARKNDREPERSVFP